MNSHSRRVITVDGLAGSGKTTLSRLLAEKLHFQFFSSGLLYRAVAYLALTQKVALDDAAKLAELPKTNRIELLSGTDGGGCIAINGKVLIQELRTPEVSEATSVSSQYPAVRAALRAAQREAFPGKDLVAEGRDMGTVIFPDAEVKFFIHADEKIRIERRLSELERADPTLSIDERKALKDKMKIEISERDKRDSERLAAPTKPAPDAIVIDNSSQTLTKVLEMLYAQAASRI